MNVTEPEPVDEAMCDVVLIGGGVMSATLGLLLRRLQPEWSIRVYERLPGLAEESSEAWNNAGTGHAALCELNYTSERPDGTIDIAKAVAINEQFQVSRQLWSHLVETGVLSAPTSFINPIPHMTFVQGVDDVDYLRRRYQALSSHPLFRSMQFSDNPETIRRWSPLLIDSRPPGGAIAATHDVTGTDVDFGSLTRQLFDHLASTGVQIGLNRQVQGLRQNPDGTWRLRIRNRRDRTTTTTNARFVFVGAGGWALKLLQKAQLPEARGYAVLPISGRFLRCDRPDTVGRHNAKVYGKAPIGAPPMSMPHLDTRVVAGVRSVLFGPYAGSSPKFLKDGSVLDLPASVRTHNVKPLAAMARDNLALVRLLVTELTASKSKKFAALQEFIPSANLRDWSMIKAGQRAQIVKKDPDRGGVLQFGTEVVTSHDGTIAAVLGASPGASTAVPIMLELLERCFPQYRAQWATTLREIIPTMGTELSGDPELAERTMTKTARTLHLTAPTSTGIAT
jgi:malate dehydrogenase (quinone)